MKTNSFQTEILRRVDEVLNRLPKERLRDVVERRFGLKDGNRQTLEAIGSDYGITRERVRQIESDAFRILTGRQNLFALNSIFEYLDRFFEEHHHLIGEERLLNLISGISEPHPVRSATLMVLTLGKPYSRFAESDRFYPYWATKNQVRNQAEKIVDYLVNHFNQKNQPLPSSEALSFVFLKYGDVPENFVRNILDISKEISENIFGEIGLSHWSEINPRGVRDKAYLVLKKEAEPHHFVEITDLINKSKFSPRQAFPQTVHNELIKDERFVLVGRGIYALKEWGYEPGIIKEVIARILSEAKKPLAKDEIISAVLNQRKVKPNTIVINLQNNKEFERLGDGRYQLR